MRQEKETEKKCLELELQRWSRVEVELIIRLQIHAGDSKGNQRPQ